ncbi:hypothetical protein Plim_2825 [Planctopirus limnophila DSM 3776]|uniref:Uncharacterized protein n=1 Tax=Planctopirus limnophila (strain ATCC 43296 / DSM 3776 / IFAM 1008 / Mu 290) TaxID=521674 RepID=D5SRF4_PLAL2|nr:hypothetical protein Plim_2825 [Planctopirus limnophila DSM 3776]
MAPLCAHQRMLKSDLLGVMKHAHEPLSHVLNFQSPSLMVIESFGREYCYCVWNLESPISFFDIKGSSNAGEDSQTWFHTH